VEGEANECLDHSISGAAGSLDRRFHCVPRGRRANSLVAHIRRDLPDPAFCDGEKDRLSAYSISGLSEVRRTSKTAIIPAIKSEIHIALGTCKSERRRTLRNAE